MKICIFSDVHWSIASSLIQGGGNNYSKRLEQLIKSMNWVNTIAEQHNCAYMFCAGDFMNQAQLKDEELTALQEITWNEKPCYFLCGNHESSVADLRFSSLKALESPIHRIISDLFTLKLPECNFLFLPYTIESNRLSLKEYIKKVELENSNKPLIIISHNDIAGINYAGFINKIGFSIDEIDKNCTLFLNGHLHNSEWVSKKALNLGSLSAHNFTNDSFNYKYGLWILDTTTLQLEFIENPFAFNFYKFEIVKDSDFKILDTLKSNAVVSIKCTDKNFSTIRDSLDKYNNIIEHRIIISKSNTDSANNTVTIVDLQVDHLQKFIDFCKTTIPNLPVVEAELQAICK